MAGLFDDVIGGYYGTTESVQLSYEEETYIENNITRDPVSLSNYTTEGYIGITQAIGSLGIAEGLCAVDILKGNDKQLAMESLADRASDAYETVKRWATRIWKAIKKYVQKAWNHLKVVKDRIVAFFTSNENVLRNYSSSEKNIDWIDMDITAAAKAINQVYSGKILTVSDGTTDWTSSASAGKVVKDTVDNWRRLLYGTTNGDPKFIKKSWNDVKGQVLQVTTMGYDKYAKDFLNFGERDYKEAMEIDKERLDDRQDAYDSVEHDENKDKDKTKYYANREQARIKMQIVRAKLQVRQRGIQLLTSATNRYYSQCVAAAKVAIRGKNNVSESFTNIDTNIYQML